MLAALTLLSYACGGETPTNEQSDDSASSDGDSDTDSDTDSDSDADADTDADGDTDADTDSDSDNVTADSDTDSDSNSRADTAGDADSDSDSDSDNDSDSDTDAASDSDTDTDNDADSDSNPVGDTDSDSDSDSDTNSDADSDTDSDTDNDTEVDTEAEIVPYVYPTNCNLPEFPNVEDLPRNEKLPDPFSFYDGTEVTSKAQWACRRKEIQAMAAKYIYGPYPFEPDETTGTVSGETVSITCKEGANTETFTATITGEGDAIALDMSAGLVPEGSKVLSFADGFENKIETLFGLSDGINSNVATGWMIDRLMDVLEQNPNSGHDPRKIVVSGCSGCGKGAFVVGVFSRVPLVIIIESGSFGGGAGSMRQQEWFDHGDGRNIYTCGDSPSGIVNWEDNGICGPWASSVSRPIQEQLDLVNHLPFDMHLLLATIAPRYLLHFTNDNGPNSWCHLNGTTEALSAWAAEPVWNALGVPERMGFYQYAAGHCSPPDEAFALANEFFKRAFDGDAGAITDVMEIRPDGVQQPVSEWKDTWIDWDMDTVLN